MGEDSRQQAELQSVYDSSSAAVHAPSRGTPWLYEFGLFRLDAAERKLLRGNEVVPLTPKAFDALLLLVRNSGHLLEKDELISTLWPDTVVEEGSLSNNIFVLRKALGEDSAFIETVPRRGYRFVGAVRKFPCNALPSETSEDLPDLGTSAVAPSPRKVRPGWRNRTITGTGAAAIAMLIIGAAFSVRSGRTRVSDRSQWIQLTNFSDSVTQPALSPDGNMVAFVRAAGTFVGNGQVYIKMLPNGEPVQLTHDDLRKMSPTFSPDGSRVAYTTIDPLFHWDTWAIPVPGGEPQPLLRNASGLSWTGPRQILFSEIKTGAHMGIVASEESRIGERDVYLPANEPGMAHRSFASPNRNWVLLVEMDQDHLWLPCRLVPMNGDTPGRQVGPVRGGCTFAAWSPDGKWMYFTANPDGTNHIWRQRFPNGQPEQITSGPTEEDGIAIAPDGRSLVTAVALQNTSLWIHDANGDRQISLEGNAAKPRFTPDGKKLCYLIVKEAPTEFTFYKDPGELRIADLESGASEAIVPGLRVLDYDVSADGQQVVMWTLDSQEKPRIWVAPLDRSSPPAQVPNVEGGEPKFGPGGEIFFRHLEGMSTFVYRVLPDGRGLRKALDSPVLLSGTLSPDGRWMTGWGPLPSDGPPSWQAFPLNGGPPKPLGAFQNVSWSLDGRSMFIPGMIGGGTYVVPLPRGEALPQIPSGGFHSNEEIAHLPGGRRIDASGIVPGPSPNVYAFYRTAIQRNLYRVPIQ